MLFQLITFLRSVTGLSEKLNLDFIFPGWTRTATSNYIAVTLIGGVFETDKDGRVTMSSARFQLDIFSEVYKDVDDISSLIKSHVDAAPAQDGHRFYLEDDRDLGEEESKKFRRSLDLTVEKQSL